MATYTEKLGLKMPAQTDFYNVDDFNENFRKIDENTARGEDIQQVLTLADPIRSNRAPTTADKQYAGKLWVVPKMIFNNMMPNALTQVAGNWHATAATVSVSGNAATLVGDGTASTIVGEVDMTAVRANDIVYIAAKMTVTADANGAVLELLCGDEVIATTSMNVPVAGNNIRLIGHTKVGTAGALKLRTTAMYNSVSAQLGKGVTISDITILDLTADMCQNFAGIEFSKDAATTYIDTYGNFQTKTYELSECWWICRGSYGGQYSWQRYDDYTNAVIDKYSTDYQNSKATTAEAQAGTNNEHWMTPALVRAWTDTTLLPTIESNVSRVSVLEAQNLQQTNQLNNLQSDLMSLWLKSYYTGDANWSPQVLGARAMLFDGFFNGDYLKSYNCKLNTQSLIMPSSPDTAGMWLGNASVGKKHNTRTTTKVKGNKCSYIGGGNGNYVLAGMRIVVPDGITIASITFNGQSGGFSRTRFRYLYTSTDGANFVLEESGSNFLDSETAGSWSVTKTLHGNIRAIEFWVDMANGSGSGEFDGYFTATVTYGSTPAWSASSVDFTLPQPYKSGKLFLSCTNRTELQVAVALGGVNATLTPVSSRADPLFSGFTEYEFNFVASVAKNTFALKLNTLKNISNSVVVKRYGAYFIE